MPVRARYPRGYRLQLIRKPDRDWNYACPAHGPTELPLQLIRKPDRDWNDSKDSLLLDEK